MTADDPLANRDLINQELRDFGHGLADKPQLLALNKLDHPDGQAQMELLAAELKEIKLPKFEISAATGEGTRELAQGAFRVLQELHVETNIEQAREPAVLRPQPQRSRFDVEVADDGIAVVRGPTPEWLAETLDLNEAEPRAEFFDRLSRLGVARALHRVGVSSGDPVRIGNLQVRWDGT
jgi:GTP-binding protein